ncbi:DUF4835 family protein [Chitinophagaceae bacterium LWZ2-11]
MRKGIILLSLLFTLSVKQMYAQELQARVTVNAAKIGTTVDKKIFNTLQTQLANFINNRKWTADVFKQNEKIDCSFLINLNNIVETNVYSASLIIQVARPVYNTTYQTALVNFQDDNLTFRYIEFQPIEFNDNRVQGTDALAANLTAVIAYYAYTILGLDYDSFAPKGGDVYYQKAQNVVNNAPEATGISGWKLFDGLRNRYWLNENLTNTRYNIIHDVIYAYYRAGLDNMYDNESDARGNILQALSQLQAFNKENTNTMFVDFFMQTKALELIGLFKKGSFDDKARAVDLLSKLDVSNAQRYKDELR